MKFRIVENPTDNDYDWESLIADYTNPNITVVDLCDRNGISKSKYYKLKPRLVEMTGMDQKPTNYRGHLRNFNVTKNVYQNPLTGKYRVSKNVRGCLEHFGTYDTIDEAIEVRDLLIDCGWDRSVFDSDIKPTYHPNYVEEHYGEFEDDYIKGGYTTAELMEKYMITHYQFHLLSTTIKEKYGLLTKPRKVKV